MVKIILPAVAAVFLLTSCSSLKPLNFTSNKQVATVPTPASSSKFIEDISVTPKTAVAKTETKSTAQPSGHTKSKTPANTKAVQQNETVSLQTNVLANRIPAIESASPVQLKYAILMDIEVESLPNKVLLDAVDEWYGVRYRTGGNTHSGVDCSGFTVAVYAAAYGLAIPRVSRDQYKTCRKISTTELQEGDLVFFNTNGRGVSHVGIYLGNNKFMHASVSRGVMVSDLFESYYLRRFVGAGRIDDKEIVTPAP